MLRHNVAVLHFSVHCVIDADLVLPPVQSSLQQPDVPLTPASDTVNLSITPSTQDTSGTVGNSASDLRVKALLVGREIRIDCVIVSLLFLFSAGMASRRKQNN